ncbi:MAG: pseudouridine synthase [Acholeplasma sp.]|nr:pseudouridine synthase [Acholeplasma sp.]
MRLDKYLSHAGYGTRTEVKEIIRKKLVKVNGEIVIKDDKKINESVDEIIVNGQASDYQKYVYLMLYKPAGVISSNFDPFHKTTKSLLIGYEHYKTFPVGRLDLDTEGLLIVTNDGLLAHQLLSPRYHVDKTYFVEFEGDYKAIYTSLFETGITLEDGYVTMPAKIELLDTNKANLTIKEGKFHQVKRMFQALDMKVSYLKRISFGPIHLDKTLNKGSFRVLTETEIEALKAVCVKPV